MAECALLRQHGPPGEIAHRYSTEPAQVRRLGYSCSLCGLCGRMCPQGLNSADMFLALRRESIDLGETDLRPYRRLLNFERAGSSRFFFTLSAPADCSAVFFPGCTLPGARPMQTLQLYRELQAIDPAMGIMLDCCNKPSHDLGRQDYFVERFRARMARLGARNIRTIVTACPSCFQAFSDRTDQLTVISAWSLLAGHDAFPPKRFSGLSCSIHDPCTMRFSSDIQADVRRLCSRLGLRIMEMQHSRDNTLCCGEGGGVGCTAAQLGDGWKHRRLAEVGARPLITYCAGCTARLAGSSRTHHLIDLLFADADLNGIAHKPVTPLRSWFNRLMVKTLVLRTKTFRTRASAKRDRATPSG